MEIISLKPTGFSSNCYIICSGNEAFVVDPSINEDRIISTLQERNLSIKGILLTHGHFDHIWRAQELRDKTGAPLYVHKNDSEMLMDSKKNAFATFTGGNFTIKEAEFLLNDNDKLQLSNEELLVIHTPGHTKGSICFDAGDFIVTGDTLFAQGFGRYDLYGGNVKELKASLSKLESMAKSENKWLYCGHGENSTLRTATEILKFYF